MERVNGECYGRRFAVLAPAALMPDLLAGFPYGWRPTSRPPEREWRLVAGQPVRAEVSGRVLADGPAETAVAALLGNLERWVAEHARHVVFVHAGCVAFGGGAVLLPGPSRAGKSTLVAALVRAGADYYSDEYAPIDPRGRALPYARTPVQRPDSPAARWAGVVDQERARPPVDVAVVADVRFAADIRLGAQPIERGTAGAAMMALLANAVSAQRHPVRATRVLSRAAARATAVRGVRGEADDFARSLLDLIAQGCSLDRN